MKEITITIPDNCELKQDGNTYTIVEKEKKLTYEDVARKLFSLGKNHIYITSVGTISETNATIINYYCPNNVTSEKQAEKLLAINKLMNVAKYLNGDWQPNWNVSDEYKYYICTNVEGLKVAICSCTYVETIYFKSEELAKKAIEILGEETIKLALCTDY